MSKISKLWRYIVKTIVYYPTYLVPPDRHLWLFGAWIGDVYGDNPKYLFEYMLKFYKNEYRIFWVTRNKNIYKELTEKGIPVLYRNSFKCLFYTLRAGVVVYCNDIKDVNFSFLINQKKLLIQLWHGVGNKKICYDSLYQMKDQQKNNIGHLFDKIFPFSDPFRFTAIIATSRLVADRLVSAMKIPEKKVFITGYPRCDLFYSSASSKRDFTKVLYAPTFRKMGTELFLCRLPDTSMWQQINEIFKKNNIKMYIKLHYKDLMNMKKEKQDISNYSNVSLVIPSALYDVQEELLDTDILITDYSSIYFDFLLLDRPVIFFAFDLEEYNRDDQGIYEPLENIAAGPIVNDWDSVLEWTVKLKEHPDLFEEKRKQVRDRFFEYQDGNSSERVYNTITSLLYNKKEGKK